MALLRQCERGETGIDELSKSPHLVQHGFDHINIPYSHSHFKTTTKVRCFSILIGRNRRQGPEPQNAGQQVGQMFVPRSRRPIGLHTISEWSTQKLEVASKVRSQATSENRCCIAFFLLIAKIPSFARHRRVKPTELASWSCARVPATVPPFEDESPRRVECTSPKPCERSASRLRIHVANFPKTVHLHRVAGLHGRSGSRVDVVRVERFTTGSCSSLWRWRSHQEANPFSKPSARPPRLSALAEKNRSKRAPRARLRERVDCLIEIHWAHFFAHFKFQRVPTEGLSSSTSR